MASSNAGGASGLARGGWDAPDGAGPREPTTATAGELGMAARGDGVGAAATAVSFFRSFPQPGSCGAAGDFEQRNGGDSVQWQQRGGGAAAARRGSGGGGGGEGGGGGDGRLSGNGIRSLSLGGSSRTAVSRLLGAAADQCWGCLRLASSGAVDGTQASSPSRPNMVRAA